MKLYTFWRSSAAFRVRIALHLKGITYDALPRSLAQGEQLSAEYATVNPQCFVPALEDAGHVLTQSLAIIEYLDETHPAPPFLPVDAVDRAQVRALAAVIACDIHPLNNLRVLKYLKSALGEDEDGVNVWYRHWIAEGFRGLEALVRRQSADGRYCHGGKLSLADICLVPQVYNARRYQCDLDAYPTLVSIASHLESLPAFAAARPEAQPDMP
jgi:maleylacetoacetate isomerase